MGLDGLETVLMRHHDLFRTIPGQILLLRLLGKRTACRIRKEGNRRGRPTIQPSDVAADGGITVETVFARWAGEGITGGRDWLGGD